MVAARRTGRELYPGSSEAEELIYANALLPLSRLPGQLADTMYRQRMASLAESEFAEKRRVAKKGDFEDYLDAAKREEQRLYGSTGGALGAATAPTGAAGAGATGRGGSPSYSVVTGPSGEQVVSGMEFGPGSTVSPDDLTRQMFLPQRGDIATRLEGQRAEGEQILAAHRTAELEAGAPPTAEERSQQLIEQLGLREPGKPGGLSERQAVAMSERELAGKGTPALDRLLTKAGVDLGERPRADQPHEKLPPANISEAIQRAMDAPEDPYRDLSEGYISWDEAKSLEGSEVMAGVMDGDYLGGKTGKRVLERRAYERYLRGMGETEAAQVLEETRKVAWAQEAREKEAFMNAMVPELKKAKMADAEAAADLWWEDPAAAGKMYSGAVSIMKSEIAIRPHMLRERNRMRESKELGEARAKLILDGANLEGLKNIALMRTVIEGEQREARESEGRYKDSYQKVVGEAPESSLQVLAFQETGAVAGNAVNDAWVAKARRGDDHVIREAVRLDMTSADGRGRYGIQEGSDRLTRVIQLWGKGTNQGGYGELGRVAGGRLDGYHIDLQLLDLEEAAIRGGDAAPTGESRVSVTQRRPMPGKGLKGGMPLTERDPDAPGSVGTTSRWTGLDPLFNQPFSEIESAVQPRRPGSLQREFPSEEATGAVVGGTGELEYRPEGIYGARSGWGYTGGVGSEIEVQPLGSGGSLSFKMAGTGEDATTFLNAPDYWNTVSTAAVRGEIVESSVYMGRPDPEYTPPRRGRGARMPPGTEDQINYLAERYEAAPYNMPPAQAQAQAQLLAYNDPDAFHRAMRSAPRKGDPERRTGPLEAGGEAAPFDTSVYPDAWMQTAHGKGMRRVNESPIDKGAATGMWVHQATKAEVSEDIVRSREP